MYKKTALQTQPFDLADERALMRAAVPAQGAEVSFTGSVRADDGVETLFLEHYAGMTEAALNKIVDKVARRWPLQAVVLIHRIGELVVGDDIVLVITASAHRQAAFEANMAIVDYLKTEVPLWKREIGAGIDRWVESSPDKATARLPD